MKKLFGLVALTFFFSACDDGEIAVQTIDFSSVPIVKCDITGVLYQLSGSEILALEIPASANAFVNEPTIPGSPRIVMLSSTNRVVYRSFNGSVSTGNICSSIPASSPNVTEEWTATSGRVEIVTTPVYSTNTTTNATTIIKYNHNIVFKDITFNKPSGTQQYSTYAFGNYQTDATSLPFAFIPSNAQKCSSSNIIYNTSGSEALILDISPSLYPNTVGVQTGLVSSTNQVTYKLFNGGLTAGYFCTTPVPATPTLNEEWNAVDGVTAVSGIIEVTTTTETATSYRHSIRLKKVTFKKGNSTFYKGDDYEFGSFVTN